MLAQGSEVGTCSIWHGILVFLYYPKWLFIAIQNTAAFEKIKYTNTETWVGTCCFYGILRVFWKAFQSRKATHLGICVFIPNFFKLKKKIQKYHSFWKNTAILNTASVPTFYQNTTILQFFLYHAHLCQGWFANWMFWVSSWQKKIPPWLLFLPLIFPSFCDLAFWKTYLIITIWIPTECQNNFHIVNFYKLWKV